MNNNVFKLKPKFRINPYLLETIQSFAKDLTLYDDRFTESEQCGGYFGFKHLCMCEEPIPKQEREYYLKDVGQKLGGYTNILAIHPKIRQTALDAANHIRRHFKIQPK